MSTSASSLLPIRWLRVLFLSVWAAAGIGMASLKWDSSVEYLLNADQDYEFKDNTLEKQRAGLNRWLIVGYSSLAFLGIASVVAQGSLALPQFRMWHFLPIGLLIWCGCSFLWSAEPSLSIRRIGHLYMAVLGAIGLVALLHRRELLWSLVITFTSLCLLGVVAELSLGTFQPWRTGYRFCGIGHPNESALFAVTAILAARVLWLLEASAKQLSLFNLKHLAIAFLIAGLMILLLTRSRTTLLSGVIAMFVIQFAYAQSTNAWLFVFSSTTVACIAGLLLAAAPSSVTNAFFGVATVGRTAHVASLTGRIPLWEEILKHWQREPLLGYGYGGYWTTKRVEDFAQIFYWEPPNGHSIYIDSLVETGPVGFTLLILTLIALILVAYWQYSTEKLYSLLFVIGMTWLIVIHGIAESSFFKGCFGPLMLAVSACLITTKSDKSRSD